MNKRSFNLIVSALVVLVSTIIARGDNSYSNAVMSLSPVAYWPLNETAAPPPAYVAVNSGTLGAQADGYYGNDYYPNGTAFTLMTLFTGPTTGVTSDGDAAAQFNGGANNNDNSGYVIIPDANHVLDKGPVPFTAEAWVKPGGGDPNDPTGTSFASTEWAGIVKKGGGIAFYTENGDANGQTYGWTISMAGIYSMGPPGGWYGGFNPGEFLKTNACWVVDFYNGGNGNSPSLEFDVPFSEPTPQWFHLVLTYDGTNAFFYTNGVLAATTVLGTSASTNTVIAPGQLFVSATGAYQFTTHNGVGYAPDTVNPLCIGNNNESFSLINQGMPKTNNFTGFNCQTFNGAMDEVAVYTNALSAATVLKHYQDATAVNTTLYTNDVLSANPPIYLRFDEPAYTEPSSTSYPVANSYGSMGSTANGLYQPGVIPAVLGAPVQGFGLQSSAVQMNGLDASVDVGNGGLNLTALDPLGTQPFSVAYWFKGNPADCYGRFQGILGRGDSGWRSSLDNSGHIRWNPGNGPEIASSGNYNDGAWHFVVGVSDGTNAYLYVDGQLSTSAGGVGSLGGTSPDLLIGSAPDYTTSDKSGTQQRNFAGQVAQAAFFGAPLTSAQVQTLYYAAEVGASISQNPQNLSIALGGSGSLTAAAVGNPTLAYQWYQGPTKLSDAAGHIIGSGTPTLTITNAQLSDAGNYTVVVTNTYGSATSTVAVVTIVPSPEIVTQPSPTSTTLYSGNQIGFSVSAIGANPLSYQWYHGTSPIGGATASNVVVTPALGANTYSCVVTNSYGSVTSTVASVTAQTFVPPASGLVVNFVVRAGFIGQGAYPDPGNNLWNAFSATSGVSTGPALSSSSNQTLVSATLIFGFNNGSTTSTTNGTPSWLLSYEDGVNTNSPGIGNGTDIGPEGQLTINDLPQGTYKVYLYGANYDGNRGSVFTLAPANGGAADGGTNGTINGSIIGTGAISAGVCRFAEGDNYVFFTNVVADSFGNITVTYVPNPAGVLTGEAPIDGVQVIGAVRPTLAIQKQGANVIISWNPVTGVLQSAASVSGPYSDILGSTSPYTNAVSGTQQFFRVRTQ
ncbi:MAG TPA: LamG-like jellyroll fold domain-containing protein [Verrucomicrobiae bacterium]|nr:LamG-like jellyroll fold domain-containing protein [Verrucomicrobiae bacterium]